MKLPSSLGSLLIILSLWTSSTQAEDRSPERVCYDSCFTCLKPVQFDDSLRNHTNFLTTLCYSPKAILSLYLCLDIYCMPGARDAGLTPFNDTCREQAHIVLPPFDVISNYTAEDIKTIHRVEQNETEGATVFSDIVIPSETWFGIWWDTLVSDFMCGSWARS